MTSDLLSVQTEQDEMSQVVSGHQHLPAHGYVHAAVPETGWEGALKKINNHGIQKSHSAHCSIG